MEIDDKARESRVDEWLSDVSMASQRWKSAKAAQKAAEQTIDYLETIKSRVRGATPDLDCRMEEAIAANRRNAQALADEAMRQSELESEFYRIIMTVEPPEVAEAWRMRCFEGRTWAQCSMALHYNRQHLEKLSKRAKRAVYDSIPEAYRHGR